RAERLGEPVFTADEVARLHAEPYLGIGGRSAPKKICAIARRAGLGTGFRGLAETTRQPFLVPGSAPKASVRPTPLGQFRSLRLGRTDGFRLDPGGFAR